jgi:uncharacterized caspase-like protein/ABC-type transporter MlaC component
VIDARGSGMLRKVLLWIVLAIMTAAANGDAFAGVNDGRRIALIIGNANYANAERLTNPKNDARAIAASLRRLGFAEVIERYDLNLNAMSDVIKSFGDKVTDADWAVVYYAGHGIEMGGTTYLVPIDAKLARDTHVQDEAVALDRLLSKVETAKRLRLVILDSCRNNPFASRMFRTVAGRSIGRGLAQIEPEGGVLVAYSAKHGTVASDGDGANSPFAEALLAHIEEPGLELQFLFRKVRDRVMESTQRGQEPFLYGSLSSEELYFNNSKPSSSLSEVAQAWAAVMGTSDIRTLEVFRRQFGAGNPSYDRLAESRIENLKRAQVAAVAPPPVRPPTPPKADPPKPAVAVNPAPNPQATLPAIQPPPAPDADPAVQFLAQIELQLLLAARNVSPSTLIDLFERYADVPQIGLYALGSYRTKLSEAERTAYYAGMARFIGRYVAAETQKYPVTRIERSDQVVRAGSGTMVDLRVIMADGSGYDVRCLLTKYGSTFKIRDVMVQGFWATPFLKALFEDYIEKNGGDPRALITSLNR